MNKEILKKHYELLQKTYDEFVLRESKYKHSRSAKIRKSELRYLKIYLMRIKSYVGQYPELYKLLTSADGTEFGRAIIWDEFISLKYFSRDMANTLRKIEGLIVE